MWTSRESLDLVLVLFPKIRPIDPLIPFLRELFLDKDSALLVVLVALGKESSELPLEDEIRFYIQIIQ